MTRDEFRQKWKHELRGMLLDAQTNKLAGAQLSLWLRGMEEKVDKHLNTMFDDSQPVLNGGKK